MGVEQRTIPSGYEIRWYEPGDEVGYLSLYEAILGSEYTTEWFNWRYDSPYQDDVPLVVATHGGEIVGARSFLPFVLRAGDEAFRALQPAGTMVHQDHRRKGLFTNLVKETFDKYAGQGIEVFFSFPSPPAKSANIQLGWRGAGEIPLRFRVQRPKLEEYHSSRIAKMLKGMGVLFGEVSSTTRKQLARRHRNIDIQRYESIPSEVLGTLYERSVPSEIHVERDSRFYGWRYANPMWTCVTYVARRNGTPVGAIIAGNRDNYPRKTVLMDSLPLGHQTQTVPAFDRLLSAVIQDYRDSSLLCAADSIAPSSLLWQYGFLRNDLPLTSQVGYTKELVVRPFEADDESAWRLNGLRVDDHKDWILTLGDTDGP